MSDTPRETSPENRQSVINHDMLARLVIREGKPFKESAIAAGYSETFACHGLKKAMSVSNKLADAIRAEWDKINASAERLKPLAINRLFYEISDPESNNGMKAIELAGRLKENDWWVRNSETNIGIFTQVIETTVSETTTLKEYKD